MTAFHLIKGTLFLKKSIFTILIICTWNQNIIITYYENLYLRICYLKILYNVNGYVFSNKSKII